MPLTEVTLGDERGLQDVADAIAGSHKVLVITGAGISTSIGIPVSCVAVRRGTRGAMLMLAGLSIQGWPVQCDSRTNAPNTTPIESDDTFAEAKGPVFR
jgi:hypothetical protein